MTQIKSGRLEGLRYSLSIVEGRRFLIKNRTSGYLAALDEIKIFLEAAIERIENGEEMASMGIC